jgi:FtsH-binding integral membrane protein
MNQRTVKNWIIASFAVFILSYMAKLFDPDPFIPALLRMIGLISSLLAVGYYVTSPGTTIGKVSFAGVIVMTLGIVFKIFHWTGADELIYAGLVALVVPFAIGLFRKKVQREKELSNK